MRYILNEILPSFEDTANRFVNRTYEFSDFIYVKHTLFDLHKD
ncbi:hypothetical protein [Staphylococcus phage APTC_SA_12]|nr:MAG: hypothetical protein [Staphylococcus phage RP2]UPO38615.1 hypothetical protein [Staphylococcus phage vB_SaS_GE1]UWV19986.1 hypothetical protein [Staphylococcus phage APTC_SA_2]UWV20140.1 hypothetical protein [Staphylococcus phage APTC_SA_4]UWV20554.1 hypothetical protein [Staphylococcus phage APTC_SA_12]UWV20570.1 hypothetical protein [Staphylococcus phage APTC_SA_13]WMT38687.1 hypothetical protein [Staphylococcus phage Sp2021]WPH66981.1 hypothetical protein CUBB_gp65 [Staphylococcus